MIQRAHLDPMHATVRMKNVIIATKLAITLVIAVVIKESVDLVPVPLAVDTVIAEIPVHVAIPVIDAVVETVVVVLPDVIAATVTDVVIAVAAEMIHVTVNPDATIITTGTVHQLKIVNAEIETP